MEKTKLPNDFIPVTNANWEETSFYQHTLFTTPEKLIKILGEPDCMEEPGDKVQWQWDRKVLLQGKEVMFTVYDWKENTRIFKGMRPIHWHIGAGNAENSLKIQNLLSNLITLSS